MRGPSGCLRVIATVLAATLFFAGCSDDDRGAGGPSTPVTDSTPSASASAAPPPDVTPVRGATATFTSGVAAGDVTSTTAVLWTRAEGGDFVSVSLSDVTDDGSAGFARVYNVDTSAARDYTVNVQVDGLTPDRLYQYVFRAGDAESLPGRFRTAPDPATSRPLRFVFSGDSDGTRRADGTPPYNEFEVLATANTEQPAFFLYVGDTIYADRDPIASTLDGYRAKYRENRGYPSLENLLRGTSVYAAWDDHEVVNDFAGATVDRAMFEAGRQAFREWMPLAGDDTPERMYRSVRWGRDAELILLDARSFRSGSAAPDCVPAGGDNPDPVPALAAPSTPGEIRALRTLVGLAETLPPGCAEAIDSPARTILGETQKAWLKERLRDSDATWKVVVTSVPVQALLALPYDRWDGYAAERRELLEFIRDEAIDNVVFLSTDFHANIFGPVRIDPFDQQAPPVAFEAIVGPIATDTLQQDIVDVLGEAAAGVFGPFLTGIARVDCAELDAYAYGLVDVDPPAGTMTITAKDRGGRALCTAILEEHP
jgi:alkaline phosphatase D